jgi:hypothetical protein
MISVSLDSRSTSRLHPSTVNNIGLLSGGASLVTYGFARSETRVRCFSSGNTHWEFDLAHLLQLAWGKAVLRW